MDSDFTTNQHLESLANGDSSLHEILNRYKFAGGTTKSNNYIPASHSAHFGEANAILLSNMLGQMQAKMDNTSKTVNLDGFQLNINSDVLKWIVLLLLVLLLVWLFLKANKRKKNPLSKKIEKLEDEISNLKRFRRKKNNLPVEEDLEDSEEEL